MREIVSVCPYCGCGCKLKYIVKGNEVTEVRGYAEDDVSEGKPCIKGLTVHETINKGRLLKPMIRQKGKLREVSWKEALEFIYQKTKDLAPEEVFFTGSGKLPNEDNWAIQKLARICYQTNNLDSCCGRLCHAATLMGMNDCFGISNLTRMANVDRIDTIFIIGSNPAITYPIFFNKIMRRGDQIKIVSVQSILNLTSQIADLVVSIEPGSDLALLNGIMSYLITNKAYSKKVEKIEGFQILKDTVKEFNPAYVSRICGISTQKFEEVCEAVNNAKLGVFHGMGFTQHVNSIENVHSLLNLAILKQGIILTLRGETNVQGAGDLGLLPNQFPTGSMSTVEHLEKLWNAEISRQKGKNILEALVLSPVKAAFIAGFNPAQSLPDLEKVHQSLRKIFLVQFGTYQNKTSEFADVILPTPTLLERNGTITSGERRIRKVNQVIPPLGDSKPEWLVIKKLSKLFGKGKHFKFKTEQEIFEEIVKVVPAYASLDPKRIYQGKDGWADKEIKYKRFYPERFEGLGEIRSKRYPFILTTFRSKYQFLTGEMSSKSSTLQKLSDQPCFYMNKEDAKELELKAQDKIKVISSTSALKGIVKIDKRIPRKVLASRFHSDKLLINKLYPMKFDEESFTPSYKAVAVRVEKI